MTVTATAAMQRLDLAFRASLGEPSKPGATDGPHSASVRRQQIDHADAQRLGQPVQRAKSRIRSSAPTAFQELHVIPTDARSMGESLLGQTQALAGLPDVVRKRRLAPLPGVLRHTLTLEGSVSEVSHL